MEKKNDSQHSKGRGRRKRNPWYQDLLYGSSLSLSSRSISAYRGVLPQFAGVLLTLRVIHLFDLQQTDEPQPWRFPGLDDSTHHLFLHSRIMAHQPQDWKEPSIVDTTLSLQFCVKGHFDYLKIGPLLPNYTPLDQSHLPLSSDQKATNLIASQMAFYLVSKYMPGIQEQWLIQRFIDPATRRDGLHLRLLPEEKKAERYRIAEWSARMDYVHTKLVDRYDKLLHHEA
jgi:hypothetical protein